MKIEEIETIIKQNSVYSTEQWQVDNLNKLKNHIDSMHNLLTEMCEVNIDLCENIESDGYYLLGRFKEAKSQAEKYLQDTKEKS